MAPMNQMEFVRCRTETIVIAVIVAAFGVFAGALYWGDLQTREPGNAERSPRQ
jgi:hypothetical protein